MATRVRYRFQSQPRGSLYLLTDFIAYSARISLKNIGLCMDWTQPACAYSQPTVPDCVGKSFGICACVRWAAITCGCKGPAQNRAISCTWTTSGFTSSSTMRVAAPRHARLISSASERPPRVRAQPDSSAVRQVLVIAAGIATLALL